MSEFVQVPTEKLEALREALRHRFVDMQAAAEALVDAAEPSSEDERLDRPPPPGWHYIPWTSPEDGVGAPETPASGGSGPPATPARCVGPFCVCGHPKSVHAPVCLPGCLCTVFIPTPPPSRPVTDEAEAAYEAWVTTNRVLARAGFKRTFIAGFRAARQEET